MPKQPDQSNSQKTKKKEKVRILNTICFLIIFLLVNSLSQAQNICEDSRYKQGGFELSSTDICHTETISIENTADVKNAVYYYNYTGQTYNELYGIGSAEETLDYSQLTKSDVYTVVQVGEKDGEKTVACEEVKVRVADQPVFSYNLCFPNIPGQPSSKLEVFIPTHPINDYDEYEITVNGKTVKTSRTNTSTSFDPNLNNTLKIKGLGGKCNIKPEKIEVIYNPRNGSRLDYFPNIDEIRILEDNTIRLDISGMYNEKYEVFRKEGSLSGTATKIKVIDPSKPFIDDTIADSDSKVYCYYIKKEGNPSCGAYILESPEICTTPLKEIRSAKNIKNDLILTSYEGQKSHGELPLTLFNISVVTQKTSGNTFDNNLPVDRRNWTSSDNDIDCTQEICYRAVTKVSGNNFGPNFETLIYSNEKCIDYKLPPFEAPDNIFVSTTDDQLNNVVFLNNIGGEYFPNRWVLYKQIQDSFIAVDSVYFGDDDIRFGMLDPDEVTQSEVYKVALIDECENSSKLSEPAHSIYLSQWDKHSITWTTESPFSNESPESYFVDYLNEAQVIEQYEESPYNSIHKIDPNPFVSYGDFRIKAVSPANKVSFSNSITLPIYGDLFLPNVFSPNGDEINDTLELVGKTEAIEEISFRIYTSSGFNVFDLTDTKDSLGKWDGTLPNGNPAPEGIYLYQLKAKMENGQIILKNGTFQLMR